MSRRLTNRLILDAVLLFFSNYDNKTNKQKLEMEKKSYLKATAIILDWPVKKMESWLFHVGHNQLEHLYHLKSYTPILC